MRGGPSATAAGVALRVGGPNAEIAVRWRYLAGAGEGELPALTVHIGGNDDVALFEICGGRLTPECQAVPGTLQSFPKNVDTILGQLRPSRRGTCSASESATSNRSVLSC